MLQVIYASAEAAPYTRKDLVELLKIARERNSAADISGMLLYHRKSFLQVLEGQQESVDSLYSKIQKDPRHTKCLLISRREIQSREFENWSMGFVDTTGAAKQIVGFVDYLKDLESMTLDESRARQTLKNFQEGAWRRAEYGGCF